MAECIEMVDSSVNTFIIIGADISDIWIFFNLVIEKYGRHGGVF